VSMKKKIGGEEIRKIKRRPIKEGLFYEPASAHEKPYLIGSRCACCGYVSFLKRPICPVCLEDGTMNEIPLSRKGKINTFTISRVAPLGFKAPYIQAFVDLPEGPRVFSLITGCEASESAIDIGSEVQLVIEKICVDEEGGELIGYKFRPV
jgi:uncharacterized OB-fold protein